jgi:hypothetical protein
METRFQKHYTVQEARQLLPQVRQWLDALVKLRSESEKHDAFIMSEMSKGGDMGGAAVNAWVRCLANLQLVLLEFFQREIQVKDLDQGLIDFPAFLDGKEVLLCWKKGEDDIEFWHDLDAGYAGRRRLESD